MFAQINNSVIHFYDSQNSDKPAIIFLHAFPLNHKMWMKQSKFFQTNYRVIAMDFRGFGVSARCDYNYSMDLFANDVNALLDYLKIEKAIVVGLSMGGYVAFRLIENFPNKISALILSSTRSEADSEEGKILRKSTIEKIRSNGLNDFANSFVNNLFTSSANSEDVKEIKEMILQNDSDSVIGALKALSERIDSTEFLQNIKVPTCIIVGEEDKLTPISCSENLNSKIKNSEMNIIPKSSHLCNIEQSEIFNKIIFNFLKKI